MEISIEEYYNNPRLSQSKLKLLLSGPKAFNEVKEPELFFEEKKHFIIGGAVDCLLTQGEEIFNKNYYVSILNEKPSDTIKSIIQEVFSVVTEPTEILSNHRDAILIACNNHNYQNNWKDDTRINKICENYLYWLELLNSRGKIILSQEEYNTINSIVQSLKTHPVSESLFNFDEFNKEIFYQFPIYFEYEKIEMKALLDIVIIDHINKEVNIYDIKTIGDEVINFYKSYSRNRYDIQAITYSIAMRQYLDKNGLEKYKINPFKFVVESTINIGNPCVFEMSEEAMIKAFNGASRRYTTYVSVEDSVDEIDYIEDVRGVLEYKMPIKGFKQLIDDYKWYVENGFDINREIIDNKNIFTIYQSYIK